MEHTTAQYSLLTKTWEVNAPNLVIVLGNHTFLEQILIAIPHGETYVHLIISMSKFSLNLTTFPTIQWDTYAFQALMTSKFICFGSANTMIVDKIR